MKLPVIPIATAIAFGIAMVLWPGVYLFAEPASAGYRDLLLPPK